MIDKYSKGLPEHTRKVMRDYQDDPPFSGKTVNGVPFDNRSKGIYVSAIGGLPLFSTENYLDVGEYLGKEGYLNFTKAVDPDHVTEFRWMPQFFTPRYEILDTRSGAHLGEYWPGPLPLRARFTINASALKFIPEKEALPEES